MIISRPTIARMCHFMIGVLVDREIESGSHNFFYIRGLLTRDKPKWQVPFDPKLSLGCLLFGVWS